MIWEITVLITVIISIAISILSNFTSITIEDDAI